MVAANENGVWNFNGKTVNIKITPPFWESPIFQWGLFGLIGIVAVGGYYIKVKSVQKRNIELSEMVEERTVEIEQKSQVAEGLKDVLGLLQLKLFPSGKSQFYRPICESLDQRGSRFITWY